MKRAPLLVVLGMLLIPAPVRAADPIAYITEIQRPGPGSALVRRAGEPRTEPAQPLLALARGDEIRITGDTRIVVLYHQGGGTRMVSREHSPFTVSAPPTAPTPERLGVLMGIVGQVFLNQQPPTGYRRLSVRDASVPAIVLVSPRRTRVLPDALTFEWTGTAASYTLRIQTPDGVVWEARNVARSPVAYPREAPRLVSGIEYTWEVEAEDQPSQRARFEVLSAADAVRVRAALETVQAASGQGYSPGTIPLMRAAVLLDEGLYADARRELLAAAAVRREPAYHMLLGHVYQRVSLGDHAARSFELARTLAGLSPGANGR